MAEPASSAAGGFALYKLGVLSGFMAVLSAIVVMAMTLPKTVREFTVAMISTAVFSICGGAFVIRYFDLSSWMADDVGLMAIGSIIFVCGLPAWVFVRAWFAYTEAVKTRSLLDLIKDLLAAIGKG